MLVLLVLLGAAANNCLRVFVGAEGVLWVYEMDMLMRCSFILTTRAPVHFEVCVEHSFLCVCLCVCERS